MRASWDVHAVWTVLLPPRVPCREATTLRVGRLAHFWTSSSTEMATARSESGRAGAVSRSLLRFSRQMSTVALLGLAHCQHRE